MALNLELPKTYPAITKSAFHLTELVGRTIALPVSLKMKQAFSKSFGWKTISFVHTIQDLTDLAGEFWLKGKLSLRREWSGRSVLTNGKRPKSGRGLNLGSSDCTFSTLTTLTLPLKNSILHSYWLAWPQKSPWSFQLPTVGVGLDIFWNYMWIKENSNKWSLVGIAVVKLSSCRVNDTSGQGIKLPGILFGSIFLLFSY